MARVTVEGSLTPCANLPTGVRKTVEYTDRVRRRISSGFYLVVSGPFDDDDDDDAPAAAETAALDPEPTPTPTPEPEPAPAGNATTEEWAEFLRSKGIEVPVNDDGETAGREELKRIWRDSPLNTAAHGGS